MTDLEFDCFDQRTTFIIWVNENASKERKEMLEIIQNVTFGVLISLRFCNFWQMYLLIFPFICTAQLKNLTKLAIMTQDGIFELHPPKYKVEKKNLPFSTCFKMSCVRKHTQIYSEKKQNIYLHTSLNYFPISIRYKPQRDASGAGVCVWGGQWTLAAGADCYSNSPWWAMPVSRLLHNLTCSSSCQEVGVLSLLLESELASWHALTMFCTWQKWPCVTSKVRPEEALQLQLSLTWDASLRSLYRSSWLEDERLHGGEPRCPRWQPP